jgi:NADH-quinone oxidoreductase subunit G
MEIATYVGRALQSELSGNVIDLCPVGALTNKPASFSYRSWELKKTESVDAMDGLGASIRIDSRGNEVIRILPRTNESINEDWLSDRSRFACDGLKRRRLDRCYVRRDGRLEPASWPQALAAVAERMTAAGGGATAFLAGDQTDCETMAAFKDLAAALGGAHLECRQDGAALDAGIRASYLFNSTIAGIDEADALLLVGTDPRREAPVLNARIRGRWLTGGLTVAAIGPETDLTYRHAHLGDGPAVLAELAKGTHPFFTVLKDAKRPMLILGQGALARPDGGAVLGLAARLADAAGLVREDWNGFNVLHTAAARVGGLDLGFVPGPGGRDMAAILDGARDGTVKMVVLLGADEIAMDDLGDAFVVYLGSHGDAGAARADVVLPGAAYTEKDATYVNTEGRVQRTRRAVFPPGEAKEDWKVARALSDLLGRTLPYDTEEDIQARLAEINPLFGVVDRVTPAAWGRFGTEGACGTGPFISPVADFYRTDPISRASETMAACSAGAATQTLQGKTGTHG